MTKTRGDDGVAAWRALLLAHAAALHAIESDLSDQGTIPLRWYDVLLELEWAPDRRLRMRELGARVVLSRTRVSRVTDELVTAGLVVKVPAPDDGRSTFAAITTLGRRELRRTAPRYLASIDTNFTALLTPQEQRTLAKVLGRVADHHDGGSIEVRTG